MQRKKFSNFFHFNDFNQFLSIFTCTSFIYSYVKLTSTHQNLSNGALFMDIVCVFVSNEGLVQKREETKGDIYCNHTLTLIKAASSSNLYQQFYFSSEFDLHVNYPSPTRNNPS